MTVTILHMKHSLDRDTRIRLSLPLDEGGRSTLALSVYENDGYEAVAKIDTNHLEEAYTLTQNGVLTPSWSVDCPEGVTPLGKGYVVINGLELGYKSSEIGDIFLLGEEAFVVDTFGFEKIEDWNYNISTPSP